MQTLKQNEMKVKHAQDHNYLTKGLKVVGEELNDIVDQSDAIIQDMIETLLKGGKKIRPRLVLLSGMCFNGLNEDMIHSAVSVELIHTASLIHDDIIDMSDLRRNHPTINHVHGDHTAVLTGDFLFAQAFDILALNNLNKSMSYFVKAIRDMCVGEIIQAGRIFNPDLSENEYIDYIGKKTSSLFSACCMAGAENSGANEEYIHLMGYFGYNIGCAFQIIDDVLDITGSKNELGKPVAHDILEGNISLPYIYFCEDKKSKCKYNDILTGKNVNGYQLQNIMEDIIKSGAVTRARNKAENYVKQAINTLMTIPSSIYRDVLIDMSVEITSRDY